MHRLAQSRRDERSNHSQQQRSNHRRVIHRTERRRHLQQALRPQQQPPHSASGHARNRHRNQRARPPLEQQDLHREQRRRHRTVERRGHARRSTRNHQHRALGVRHRQQLAHNGANRSARDDHRPLRAERSARTDGDRRRNRLQHRNARLNSSAAEDDGLHSLGHAVPANLGRQITRNHADDQTADHRHQHQPPVPSRLPGIVFPEAPMLEVEEIRAERDHLQQRPRGQRAHRTQHSGQRAGIQNPAVCGVVPKLRSGARCRQLG